jgi:lysozyme
MTIRRKAIAGGTGIVLAASAFIAPWEGFKPVASHNSFDPRGVVDYGYGTTNGEDPSIKVGDKITEPEARTLLAERLGDTYIPPIRQCIKDFDAMPWGRQVAFISMSYNLGAARVCHSAAVKHLNRGEIKQACDSILEYDRADGKVLLGLQRRRSAERELCLKG